MHSKTVAEGEERGKTEGGIYFFYFIFFKKKKKRNLSVKTVPKPKQNMRSRVKVR